MNQISLNDEEEKKELTKWQVRLLPLMRITLIILMMFFFIASFIQLAYLHNHIGKNQFVNSKLDSIQLDKNNSKGLVAIKINALLDEAAIAASSN